MVLFMSQIDLFLILFLLDRNTWYHTTVCKLFVLDRNTWFRNCVKKQQQQQQPLKQLHKKYTMNVIP